MTIMSDQFAPISLYDLLSNSIVLLSICPLLPLSSILALTGTSRAISDLIWKTPLVFKRIDLSTRTIRHQNPEAYDVARTKSYNENANYVSNCFDRLGRKTRLQSISIMILDGLPVTEAVLSVIIKSLNVRLLSIRGITNSWDSSMRNVFNNLLRPILSSRRSHSYPKLKGLYCFGPADSSPTSHAAAGSLPPAFANTGMMSTPGAQLGARAPMPNEKSTSFSGNVGWYDGNGEMPLPGLGERKMWKFWEIAIDSCAGLIAFDAIPCRGCPMADDDKGTYPRLATISLKGCKICGSCPEGPACVGESPESYLPLLAPLPLYSSTVRVAQIPPSEALSAPQLIARCEQCLKGRWCRNCNAWWCESCYTTPAQIVSEVEGLQEKWRNVSFKVHLGLCVDQCLVSEMYSGVGEGGMWG